MNVPLFLCGLGIWMGATIALRLAGQRLLLPDHWTGTLLLFAVSFPLMALLVRRLCRRIRVPRDKWLAGAVSVMLPTLIDARTIQWGRSGDGPRSGKTPWRKPHRQDCGSGARIFAASSSALVSLRNVPQPLSIPAMYLSFTALRV